MMPKPQPTFTAEFKHEAVQLARTSSKPKAQIARELGISDSALYAWCKQAEEHGTDAFPGKGHQMPLEEENHQLKRELERVRQERDILKKAISIFSRSQP
jgi:transposase